jgi:hypothetical protein
MLQLRGSLSDVSPRIVSSPACVSSLIVSSPACVSSLILSSSGTGRARFSDRHEARIKETAGCLVFSRLVNSNKSDLVVVTLRLANSPCLLNSSLSRPSRPHDPPSQQFDKTFKTIT